MESCCINTLQNLESSDNLIASLVIGIKILEVTHIVHMYMIVDNIFQNSGILNAGIGSNRNIEGFIEADASIMQLDPPCLGSIGCASGFQNPIECAESVFYNAQETKKWSRYQLFFIFNI